MSVVLLVIEFVIVGEGDAAGGVGELLVEAGGVAGVV